jgi:hypothetical protein
MTIINYDLFVLIFGFITINCFFYKSSSTVDDYSVVEIGPAILVGPTIKSYTK